MAKWEYKHVEIKCRPADVEKVLNEFGKDRWELCYSSPESFYVVFKRPIPGRVKLPPWEDEEEVKA